MKFKLDFDEDTSTAIIHSFVGVIGSLSIIGGFLADQYIGKYKAIIWISSVYILGHLIFTLVSIPYFGLPAR